MRNTINNTNKLITHDIKKFLNSTEKNY